MQHSFSLNVISAAYPCTTRTLFDPFIRNLEKQRVSFFASQYLRLTNLSAHRKHRPITSRCLDPLGGSTNRSAALRHITTHTNHAQWTKFLSDKEENQLDGRLITLNGFSYR